jgi:alpha-tubulin suppressor-like RCC1 family protein
LLALSQDSSRSSILSPEEIKLPNDEAASEVACGLDFSCVLTESGHVLSWGGNEHGQLGLGHTRTTEKPSLVSFGGEKIISVSCGSCFAVALSDNGSVFGWGSNSDGQLLRHKGEQSRPQRLALPTKTEDEVVRVVCGNAHVLALTRGGHVLSWGRRKNGQLGRGEAEGAAEIGLFDGIVHKGVAIACGAEHSFVMTELGRVYGFGSNAFGQLGIGMEHKMCQDPTEVTHFADEEHVLISGISCGAHHTVVLTDDGRVYAMGW